MNGADAILAALIDGGIDVCFANPGTSEMHFVSALDRTPGLRCVLGLAETVVTGAADGYARVAGKPAVTLLHTGPGLANGLSNLHNARRAPVPIVNIVGDHATYHSGLDAPLASDVAGLAKTMSHWVHRIEEPIQAAADTATAIRVAREGAGRIATLILPADIAWADDVPMEYAAATPHVSRSLTPDVLAAATKALEEGKSTMLLLGGNLSRDRLRKAAAIEAKYGVRIARELFPTLLAHGASTPTIEHMPYPPELMHSFMANTRHLILLGANPPTTFFAYPGVKSVVVPDGCRLHTLAGHDETIDNALDALGHYPSEEGMFLKKRAKIEPAKQGGQSLDAKIIADLVAESLPIDSIVIEEAISSSPPLIAALSGANAHEMLFAAGGSIGWAIPAAVGAAIAAPDRKVVCLTGDGSALYSIQGLWTLARECLDVVILIYANRDYSILKTEFDRVGAQTMGDRARAMMTISNPVINFCALAESFGVAAVTVGTPDALTEVLANAMANRGPFLIEATIRGATAFQW